MPVVQYALEKIEVTAARDGNKEISLDELAPFRNAGKREEFLRIVRCWCTIEDYGLQMGMSAQKSGRKRSLPAPHIHH